MSIPVAMYSPVGSNPLVSPKSVCAVRSTPPLCGVACCSPPPPSSSPPPHAAATRATARASPTTRSRCRLLPIDPPLPPWRMVTIVGACVGWSLLPSPAGRAGSPFGGPERVPEAVAYQIERQGGCEQEQAGEHHHPPGDGEDRPGGGVGQHPSPGGRGLGHPHAQERQGRLEQDVGRDQQGRVHDDRSQQ